MCCWIDLHLHLDGSLPLPTVKCLAARQGISLPGDEQLRRLLTVDEDCRDLNEYLKKFEFPLSLLQTEDAIETAVYRLGEKLKEQDVIYAEIRFAPQLHCQKGLSQEQVVKAAIRGSRQTALPNTLILCCMRGSDNMKENRETLSLANAYWGKGVAAADLAGAEARYPTDEFADLFAYARELAIPFTIHAGEADGPDSVRRAMTFGAFRIGHGVRAAEDKALMKKLAKSGVTLELCPTSNLNTAVFRHLEEYPLRTLMDAGVRVTVNTDNITVSATSIEREWRILIDTFKLTNREVKMLLLNSADAAFVDSETKAQLKAQICSCYGG